MKTKLKIFTILPKITINWEIYIHFIKVFYTKVSRIRRLTEAGHILLGRPWKFDRKIIYNGLTNEITLTHFGTKFVLHPQTPS